MAVQHIEEAQVVAQRRHIHAAVNCLCPVMVIGIAEVE